MKARSAIIATTAACWTLTHSFAGAQNTSFHNLTVKRWSGTNPVYFSDSRADTCLNAASSILLTDSDGAAAADVFCNANLTRSGSVGTFTATDGYLDTYSEWDQVANYTPGFVKVVKTITYCSGVVGSVAGCTERLGLDHIVLSQGAVDSSVCGKYVAHEFGHAVGLADTSTANNVMRQGAFAYGHVIGPQCTNYRSNFVDHDGPGGGSAALRRAPSEPREAAADTHALDDLAGSGLGSHVPGDAIGLYGKKEVRALIKRLKDPRHPRAGIFQLVGLIGADSEKTAWLLMDYVDAGSDDLDALSSAVISLGYLSFHGSQDSVEYLIDLSEDPRAEYASWAVSALGVSGLPQAGEHLIALLSHVDRKSGTGCRSRELIELALDANQKVRDKGLRAYYGH